MPAVAAKKPNLNAATGIPTTKPSPASYVNDLEASHMMLAQCLVDKAWVIHDEEIENLLKDVEIQWSLTVKPNSFDQSGRIVGWQLNLPNGGGYINSFMELMIKNCGAAVWAGIDNLSTDLAFKVSEFIARNVASTTGTGVIIATGTKTSGQRLEKLGWSVPIYRDSSRWSGMMAYGMLSIPKEQMAKYGYNHCYTTTG
jgi:hypothetical protein